MLTRLQDFGDVLAQYRDDLPSVRANWSAGQVSWAADWVFYISKGGTRPNPKPPL